ARSVSLENGCHFKGSIDMQSDTAARPIVKSAPPPAAAAVVSSKGSNGSEQLTPIPPPRVGA
ncbi:MAG TPA: hypothetical protein VIE88_16315, partial [Vicinamibacteria bacterium]